MKIHLNRENSTEKNLSVSTNAKLERRKQETTKGPIVLTFCCTIYRLGKVTPRQADYCLYSSVSLR